MIEMKKCVIKTTHYRGSPLLGTVAWQNSFPLNFLGDKIRQELSIRPGRRTHSRR